MSGFFMDLELILDLLMDIFSTIIITTTTTTMSIVHKIWLLFYCSASLQTHYLTPYLEYLGPNLTNGANFAISGSSTLPRHLPFSLDVQVLQFLRFRARSLHLILKCTYI
ncbi:glycine-rich protein [Prunus dulcis]|uniref:Glycine-rich protein n=1 Tax=Prunus dulcis TaxID=3755 RepID=A0A4Y1R3C9_PRUDU|nr:glycine-rich protein [Prunus dulcis]